VSPTHKLEIVRALQRSDRVVAMTGDGINDGPALRAADIGVAMGRGGTDAAREIADIVLADDELGTMVVAVRHGRTIYRNIRKSVHYLVATNGSELLLTVSILGLGAGQALTPVQLLWLNVVSEVWPALALAIESPEPDTMRVPPRERGRPIIGNEDYGRIAFESSLLATSALGAHLYGVARYGPRGGGIGFLSLISAQILHAVTCRSDSRILLMDHGLAPNRQLFYSTAGLIALQAIATVVPPLRSLLGLTLPGPIDLAVVAAATGVPFLISQATKPAPRNPMTVQVGEQENSDAR
jgi:Ca2+-transporting ATPase